MAPAVWSRVMASHAVLNSLSSVIQKGLADAFICEPFRMPWEKRAIDSR